MTDIQKQAYNDYLNGMKYADISNKYGVPVSTVKTWANRYFKINKVSNSNETSETQITKKMKPSPLQKGGQAGNENTVKHGAYRKVFDGFLDEEENSLLADISKEPENVYLDELELYTVRERWILQQIVEIKKSNADNRKLMLNSVTKIVGENKDGHESKTITETTAAFNYLKVLETELTKIQAGKNKCAAELAKLRKTIDNNSNIDEEEKVVINFDICKFE